MAEPQAEVLLRGDKKPGRCFSVKITCHQACQPESIPKTHTAEGENRLLQAVLGALHLCHGFLVVQAVFQLTIKVSNVGFELLILLGQPTTIG